MLAFTANDHWEPGIGDPTVIGWVTVVAYFLAAISCWRATLVSKRSGTQPAALFWLLFTGFLLFLGINKQLDLQTWFTLFGKHLAEKEGWYAKRRIVQAGFILLIALLGVWGWILLWKLARKRVRHHGLALTGGVFLGCFILIRAASFHYVDQMLGLNFDQITLNCVLELGGIVCVAVASWKQWRHEEWPTDPSTQREEIAKKALHERQRAIHSGK